MVPAPSDTLRRSVRTAGVLLDIADERHRLVVALGPWVARAVDEHRQPGDPPGRWDPTYLADLRDRVDRYPWMAGRLAGIDRVRVGYEDLLCLETTAQVVCEELVGAVCSAEVAWDRLTGLAGRRTAILDGLGRAERCIRIRLTPPTASGLRRAVRALAHAEAAAGRARSRLADDRAAEAS